MALLPILTQYGIPAIAFILAIVAIVLSITASNRVDKSVNVMRAALNEPNPDKRNALLNDPVLLLGRYAGGGNTMRADQVGAC